MQHWPLNKINGWMQTRSSEVLRQLVAFAWSWVETLNQNRQGDHVCVASLLPSVGVGATASLFRFIISFFNREFVSISFQGQIKHMNGVCVEMRAPKWEQNNAMSCITCSLVEHPPGSPAAPSRPSTVPLLPAVRGKPPGRPKENRAVSA